jgi:hypothetical protein
MAEIDPATLTPETDPLNAIASLITRPGPGPEPAVEKSLDERILDLLASEGQVGYTGSLVSMVRALEIDSTLCVKALRRLSRTGRAIIAVDLCIFKLTSAEWARRFLAHAEYQAQSNGLDANATAVLLSVVRTCGAMLAGERGEEG